jgi:glycosyltransferase involved in cell wall biosynthesis
MTNGKKPLTLALIIPVFNEERYLEECLNSIQSLSVMPDEVIVVDNNSSDASAKIAQKYKFVKVIKEQKQGIVYARDAGFNTSNSDIIARMDADTMLPKNWVGHIKKFYSKSENLNQAWTGGGIFRNTRWPKIYGWLQSQIAFRFNRLLMGHYILWGSNMAITRTQWLAVRSNTCKDVKIHEDLDLAIHLDKRGYEITYQAFIKVSVVVKRLYQPKHLRDNLMLWPKTLKKHNKKTWIFGWLGAIYLYTLRRLVFTVSSEKRH